MERNSHTSVKVPALQGLRVKELFLTLFPKDYSAEEWKLIFERTNRLSMNRGKLREIEGLSDLKSNEIRAHYKGENLILLPELTALSVFVMSWSATDENCKISKANLLSCKPFHLTNSLNGEMPTSPEPAAWINPDPVRDSIRIPYLSLRLEKLNSELGQNYSIELRLKIERMDDREILLKGDALPRKGSRFRDINTFDLVEHVYPFGYAEMSLERKSR